MGNIGRGKIKLDRIEYIPSTFVYEKDFILHKGDVLLNVITGDHSRKELQEMLGLKNADHFRKAYLLPATNAGLVEMTRPDKPKSRLQKYRLTARGLTAQKEYTK